MCPYPPRSPLPRRSHRRSCHLHRECRRYPRRQPAPPSTWRFSDRRDHPRPRPRLCAGPPPTPPRSPRPALHNMPCPVHQTQRRSRYFSIVAPPRHCFSHRPQPAARRSRSRLPSFCCWPRPWPPLLPHSCSSGPRLRCRPPPWRPVRPYLHSPPEALSGHWTAWCR